MVWYGMVVGCTQHTPRDSHQFPICIILSPLLIGEEGSELVHYFETIEGADSP